MKKKILTTTDPKTWTKEETENIVGFFDLLLKIDRRHNPERYKKNKKK